MPDKTVSRKVQRSKGRPRGFDRGQALVCALGVFWKRGYEPASMTELCSAMGINAPSLYAAFGNKASLFLEAVRFYEQIYWDAPSMKMLAEPDLPRAIDTFFKDAAHILLSPDTPCGCVVALGAINISENEIEVIETIRQLRLATKELFAKRLRRGVEDGQLPVETDIVSLAAAFNTVLEGMSIQARDGLSQEDMVRLAAYAVRLLPQV